MRVFIVKNKQKIIRIELGHNKFIEFNSSGVKRRLNPLNWKIEQVTGFRLIIKK